MADHSVQSIRYPRWLKQGGFDFQNATAEQQEFIKENLFKRVLPVEETQPPKANAILEEQKQWISHITSGTELVNSGPAAAHAVRVAARILEQIEHHDWGLPKILPFATRSDGLPEELTKTATQAA